jgi:membrane fusion protein (multidrug efflux system)
MNSRLNLLVLLLFAVVVGCGREPQEESGTGDVQVNVPVDVAKIESGPMRQIIEASGTLKPLPDRDAKVSALVAGRVAGIDAIEGDPVAKDSVIARLDSSTYQDQLRQAKATLDNARSNQERQQRLYERGIAARKEWEDAQRDLLVAEAAYNTARVQVERTIIRAPFTGVVVKRYVNIGEQVDGTAGQPIVEIANFDPIELIASLQATFLAAVKEGQQASVKTDAFEGAVFQGQIVSILPAIDAGSNVATLRIRIPNPDHKLRGGMFATASIIASVHEHALYVPARAISTANNGSTIFVVKPDSTVEQRTVRTGWRDGDRVEILSNAKNGETVVTTGSYGLAGGMHVTVKPS